MPFGVLDFLCYFPLTKVELQKGGILLPVLWVTRTDVILERIIPSIFAPPAYMVVLQGDGF